MGHKTQHNIQKTGKKKGGAPCDPGKVKRKLNLTRVHQMDGWMAKKEEISTYMSHKKM